MIIHSPDFIFLIFLVLSAMAYDVLLGNFRKSGYMFTNPKSAAFLI